MSADANLAAAAVMIELKRFQEAERLTRESLAADLQNTSALIILTAALSGQGRVNEALEIAQNAVRAAPLDARTHYALATILAQAGKGSEALNSVHDAIDLNPENADYIGLLARLRLERQEWKLALNAAERGLALDPDHNLCANIRARALVALGRGREAAQTVDAALQRNPEDPLSHATQGWAYMNQGDMKKAFEHFREALRLYPNDPLARQGVMEAMKARNPIYHLLLRSTLVMTRLPSNVRFGIIIGGVVLFRVLRDIAGDNPALAPLITPFLILYIAFILLSWLGDPLFNSLLRLDRFGRTLLGKTEVAGSNWFLLIVLIVTGAVILGALLQEPMRGMLFGTAFFFGLFLFPISGLFRTEPGTRARKTLVRLAAVLIVLLVPSLVGLAAGTVGTWPQIFYVLGVIGFTWVTSFMLARARS